MPTHAEVIEQLVERAEQAEADLRTTAEMLEVYGRHDWQCRRYDPGGDQTACSCGYDDALGRADAAADRVTP